MEEQVDYQTRKQALKDNQTVKRPISRIDADVLPTPKKKNHKMTPRKMLGEINRYFDWCEKNDEMPSLSGMMIHMKMYRDAFHYYVKDDRYRDMLEQARLVIKNWAETDVYNTKGLAAGKVAYMKNVMGWSEKIESMSTNVQIDMSPEAARAKIESLAPKLLEVLKNQNLLNQLVKNDSQDAILIEEKANG